MQKSQRISATEITEGTEKTHFSLSGLGVLSGKFRY
jgi:hypothetical protein